MSTIQPQAFYSHENATGTGAGATIDCTAFTQDSSCLITVANGATVLLQGNLDPSNDSLWVDVSQGGYTENVWLRIPKEVQYMRTYITVAGLVTSSFGRGISSDRPLSNQGQLKFSSAPNV